MRCAHSSHIIDTQSAGQLWHHSLVRRWTPLGDFRPSFRLPFIISKPDTGFYRAILCIRGTSHGPVSVRVLSQVGVLSKRLNESNWFLATFHPSYTVLKGNSVISKNKGTSLWNFVLNSELRKFRHGISIVETCYQLSSRKVDAHSVINWVVVGQLSW